MGGLIFANGAVGTDAIIAAVVIVSGVKALTTGIAIGEIITALRGRSDGEPPTDE